VRHDALFLPRFATPPRGGGLRTSYSLLCEERSDEPSRVQARELPVRTREALNEGLQYLCHTVSTFRGMG
jgi:hypothetical protein